jgi:hypothetical protein
MSENKCKVCSKPHDGRKHANDPTGLFCGDCSPRPPHEVPCDSALFDSMGATSIEIAEDNRKLREAIALAVLKCTPALPATDVKSTCIRILDWVINGDN